MWIKDPDPDPGNRKKPDLTGSGSATLVYIHPPFILYVYTTAVFYYRRIQDTDKTVRVECAFTAEDQTVSFRPTAGSREDGGGISVT